MKQIILILILVFSVNIFSQIHEPVKWSTSVEKISDTEYNLITTATIDSGWHLYSQKVPEDGPIPTTFTYDDDNGAFKIIGNTSEEEGHKIDDPIFEMKIKFFENSARFVQKIEVLGDKTAINSFVEFMVCDDTKCLPPTEVDLMFNLSSDKPAKTKEETVREVTTSGDNNSTPPTKDSESKQRSLWAIFIIAFFSGFAALMTPCVFPMIPMTVSFYFK